MNKDDIKPYIVKVKGLKYEGSGVIVKSKNNNFYIFTAKHNFAYNNDAKEHVEKIKIESIQHDIKHNKIKILEQYLDIKIVDVIGLNDIFVDFVILVIDKEDSENLKKILKNKKPLVIFNGFFQKSVIYGYINNQSSIEEFECKSKSHLNKNAREKDYEYVFEVKSEDDLSESMTTEMNTISGISGGGVFLRYSFRNIYIVGIQIEYHKIKKLICINLETIINEINEKLEERDKDKIKVVKYRFRYKIIITTLVLMMIFFTIQTHEDISKKTFTLTMQRFDESALSKLEFFENKECNEPKYNASPVGDGKYILSDIQIEEGKNKNIYIKNELINCRQLTLNTSKDSMTFTCGIDCDNMIKEDSECAYPPKPECTLED